MDHNGYPLFSDEDYQTLFQSQFADQSIYAGQSVDPNCFTGQYWAPFLESQQPVNDTLLSTSGASIHATSTTTHKETGATYPMLFDHAGLTPEQALSYSYYWHLLTNSSPVDNNLSDRADSPNFDPGATVSDNVHSEIPSRISNQSSLYSAMLKKGLNIIPGLKTNDDLQHPKLETSRNNQRRNSYPNSNPSIVRPSASMPLDPISLNESCKTKKTPKVVDETIHEVFRESWNSKLNNSVNISCSPCSKCTLNVNNDFSETVSAEEKPELLTSEKSELSETQPTKRRSKSKPPQSSFQDAATGVSNSQDFFKRSKSKTNQCKGKSRTDKGKSHHRKRHSVPDTDDSSPLFNLVFQLKVFLSQVPIQPLLVSLMESVASLAGTVVGLIGVLAILSYEWAQTLFHLVRKWVLFGWQYIRAHGGGLISALFLRIPNGYYTSATNKEKSKNSTLESNLPKTGEEAVQRLLKLKQTDPYSILGITSDATDEDIKRSYKSQAILVHPDKNHFPGAEEAFKTLGSAFEILGNPESRAQYDKDNTLNNSLSEASQEIVEFLEKLKQNIEEAQSILGCQNCGKGHKRYRMDRTPSEARYCASCKEKHSAKEGDLWAETSMMGFKWHYYSHLDGAIYDVTEWVTCQPNLVSRVEANTHSVPCRLATPKNKNKSAAFKGMEDLKDLFNDLLNANQAGGLDPASQRSAPQSGKTKAKRTAGGRKKK